MNYAKNFEQAAKYYNTAGAFLTVRALGKTNTMTVSWGFIGYFWHKPYFIVGVRPQRFTKTIIDKADSFTISIPFGTMAKELAVCGTKSGADINKADVIEFIPAKKVNSPVVKGCDMYYECKLTHNQLLDGKVLPQELQPLYNNGDYHYFYFGEIVDCYEK
ncbi:Conserved domain [Elusimicrobium minutum Pei191]|uniref:Conserved domain n=1 Tax=Elusimicrobium minutum (strain Pei191) TaxID=445932 RepID=B2KBW7_ELUMP|nr:flavin reductase family protein [Elusimicrobium minutum]ACC97871.1 Conserved domain [Elusimicrobium minutum Pei191]